jgi:hypothetical protein
MSDWFENFSDNIENNAGAYAALGGLAALNNQRAQTNKLAALQRAQQQSAKTEKERLAVEQRRLELEKARFEEERATREATKSLRRLMAEVGSELDRINRQYSVQGG